MKKHTHPYINEISLLYLRYIGSIIMIRKSTKAEIITFIQEIKRKPKTIKFDQNIQYLTQWYTKTKLTISKQLHIANSFLKISIPYSQALRLKTVCSKITEYNKNCAIIKQKFLGKQYKGEVLDEQIRKVDITKIKELFTNKEDKTELYYEYHATEY